MKTLNKPIAQAVAATLIEAASPVVSTPDDLLKQYYQLCDQRDTLYAKAQPLEDKLTQLNDQIQPLQVAAQAVAAELDSLYNAGSLFLVKKQIRQLAAYLGKIPPREKV
jgi:uncharacterized protein (DUF3084 family)